MERGSSTRARKKHLNLDRKDGKLSQSQFTKIGKERDNKDKAQSLNSEPREERQDEAGL